MSSKKKWQNSGHIGGEFPELFNRDKTYPEGTEVRTIQGLGPVSNKKGAAHSSLCFPAGVNVHSLLLTALQTVTPCGAGVQLQRAIQSSPFLKVVLP